MTQTTKYTLSLIQRVKQGSSEAYRLLQSLYMPLINSKAAQYAGSALEGDELVQIASIALYDAALSYEPDKSNGKVTFGLYAEICISNRIRSELRKQKTTGTSADETLLEEENVSSPEEKLIAKEDIYSLLESIYATLSPYESSVFKLYLLGYSVKESARHLSKTEKSVENTLQRIKKKIRCVNKDNIS